MGGVGCNVLPTKLHKNRIHFTFHMFVQNSIYNESNSNSLNDSFSKTKKLPILNSQFSLFYYKYQPITQSPFILLFFPFFLPLKECTRQSSWWSPRCSSGFSRMQTTGSTKPLSWVRNGSPYRPATSAGPSLAICGLF